MKTTKKTLDRITKKYVNRIMALLETAREEGREELRQEQKARTDKLIHEQDKLLDGFNHPKNCKYCQLPIE